MTRVHADTRELLHVRVAMERQARSWQMLVSASAGCNGGHWFADLVFGEKK